MISKNGYIDINDNTIFRANTGNESVEFLMIEKCDNEDIMRVILSTNVKQPMVGLNVIFPNERVEDDIRDDELIRLQSDYENGYSYLEVNKKICQDNSGFIRLVCQIIDTAIFNAQHLKLFVVVSNQIKVVQIPKAFDPKFKNAQFWDIGLIDLN